jgi:hypothetical protein
MVVMCAFALLGVGRGARRVLVAHQRLAGVERRTVVRDALGTVVKTVVSSGRRRAEVSACVSGQGWCPQGGSNPCYRLERALTGIGDCSLSVRLACLPAKYRHTGGHSHIGGDVRGTATHRPREISGAKLRGGTPPCTATKVGRRKAFLLLVQRPLLREPKVLLVAWGFSVPWVGGSRNRRRGGIPIWWVRAQGFEP